MDSIFHLVTIKAGAENVYEALVSEKGLSSWWSTRVSTTGEEGSVVDFKFLEGFNPDMKITKLDPSSRVEWECVGGHDPWEGSRFVFDLESTEGKTILRFTQDYANEISRDDYGTYNYNWAYYLESLRLYCEEGKGKPFEAA